MATKYNRLRVILAEKDISNKKFAQMMDTSETTVSGWVTNQFQPSLKKIYQWATVLKVEAKEFIYPMTEMDRIEVDGSDE